VSRVVICTVGTSLLTNWDERPWSGWRRGASLPKAQGVDRWLSGADPMMASAEIHTVHQMSLSSGDTIALLHSNTEEGRFCAERLQTLWKAKVQRDSLRRIGNLRYAAAEFGKGLKTLVDAAVGLVREARKRKATPVFAATGGFKAEIAFINLLGALLKVEVYYIHELHRELVRLPVLPLAWDSEFAARHWKFYEWIEEKERSSAEVEGRLKGMPELRPLVEDAGDGCTYLSAAGNLLFRALRERAPAPVLWPKADPRPPEKKNNVSLKSHHRPRGWERVVERICSIDCVTSVRYEEAAFGGDSVRVMDAKYGIIGFRHGADGMEFPLRVETTARGQQQCELVAGYLKSLK